MFHILRILSLQYSANKAYRHRPLSYLNIAFSKASARSLARSLFATFLSSITSWTVFPDHIISQFKRSINSIFREIDPLAFDKGA